MSIRARWTASFTAALLSAALLLSHAASAQERDAKAPVIVFAAASLKNALDAISSAWSQESGQTVKTSYAASFTLAKDVPAKAAPTGEIIW